MACLSNIKISDEANMHPTTAFYFPAFLGPLGQFSDQFTATAILRERRTALQFELVVDLNPRRVAWERLFAMIRRGRVNRLIVRCFSDLCLTPPEVEEFGTVVIDDGMDFVRLLTVPQSVLFAGHPRCLGLYRHRQRVAKVIWLRRHGYRIEEICRMAYATPKQAARVLITNGGAAPLTLF